MAGIKASKVTKLYVPIRDDEYEGEVEISDAAIKKLTALSDELDAKDKEANDAAEKLRAEVVKLGLVTKKPKKLPPEHLAKVRLWASRNGHQVNARARIPAITQAAYDKAAAEGKLKDDEK